MRHLTPIRLMIIAFVFLLLGVILPFLMVMEIFESTFFLNFLSFILSLIGIVIGVIGSVYYVRINRRDQ